MARSFYRAPSTENDYGPPIALAPGRRHCFSDTPGILPAVLSQNHRMAGPQESACLKESNPPLGCPRTGPGGSLGMRFTRQLLDLITRQSAPHLDPSTLTALHCRKVMLADFSATPSPLADTGWEPTSPPSRCTSRITVRLEHRQTSEHLPGQVYEFPRWLQEVASTEIACFAVLEARNVKSECGQGRSLSGRPLRGSFLPLPAPVAPGTLGLWPRPSDLCPRLHTASPCASLLCLM